MHKCQVCSYSTEWSSNLRKHERAKHNEYEFNKKYFKNTIYSNNSRSQEDGMYNDGELNQNYNNNTLYSMNQDVYDIRLKENFKLFISGPSRCGKTVFVSNLLERINEYAKVPPTKVIYIYKVWQSKYDEMLSLGVNFKEDHNNIVNDIKSSVSGEPTLIIFDDLIGSSSLKEIANLFTVDARHMNMSLVFLTQRMFVNDESFRQISQNCYYFVLFNIG